MLFCEDLCVIRWLDRRGAGSWREKGGWRVRSSADDVLNNLSLHECFFVLYLTPADKQKTSLLSSLERIAP